MSIPFLICSALIVTGGLIFSIHRKNRTLQDSLAYSVVWISGLFMLGTLLVNFSRLDSDQILSLNGWQLPFANFTAGIDPLSAFFLFPLLILAVSSSIYSLGYFGKHPAGKSHGLFFGMLIAGMILVLLSRNGILFLLAWELMSLSSFFLVITDKENPDSNRAGWIYFVTAHIGTAFLLILFFLLSSESGSFDFSSWKGIPPGSSNWIFIFALIAFGLKAGFIPFHVWLPLAHPAAPSPVSALMSGIMIKMGIYGILRVLTFIAPFQVWWGILLIAIGALSGILGVLFAIGQHDVKRLLAYHSVENIGIILLGLGIGVTGSAAGFGVLALYGFAGGLLHIVNHALFKALLFLGAGAVIRQTGTGEIDRLGGLIKRMPWTGSFFLIGAAAICGLPFLNGFISELFIYKAGILGAIHPSNTLYSLAGVTAVCSLALIGGLAAACFTKIFGIVFLGEPRTDGFQARGEAPVSMLLPMAFLALLCIGIGICSFAVIPFIARPALALAGPEAAAELPSLYSMTRTLSIYFPILVAIAVLIVWFVRLHERRRGISSGVATWDCGFHAPKSSMQYTASSFAAPIVRYFGLLLGEHQNISKDETLLPTKIWRFHSGVDDWFLTRIYAPVVESMNRLFSHLRWFQCGKAGVYVFYIALTVLCLICWKFLL